MSSDVDPKDGGRSPKRQRSISAPDSAALDTQPAEHFVDVVPTGDMAIIVDGLANLKQLVGLRVSSHILKLASPKFEQALDRARIYDDDDIIALRMLEEDGDTMLLLCNILHLRNNVLPAVLTSDALYKLAVLSYKLGCVVAVGRATMQWFEELLTNATSREVLRLVEAAYLLDEPTSFARFTERWIAREPIGTIAITPFPGTTPNDATPTMRLLAGELFQRRISLLAALRTDLDILVDPCTLGFTDAAKHYIDYAPGMKPEPDERGRIGSLCRNDMMAGADFLGALREDGIWPPTVWPSSLEAIVKAVQAFEIPEYDDCDKCDFCEDVKAKFKQVVPVVKQIHRERMWGMCLDCFHAGVMSERSCRNHHTKSSIVAA